VTATASSSSRKLNLPEEAIGQHLKGFQKDDVEVGLMEPGFRIGDWQVQPDVGTLTRGEEQVQLEPKVMEVLVYLARHPGDVLPKEKIIRAVWPDTFVTDEVLTNAISELRKGVRR
jgi:DNA-binding winged helix-turn-helix (wHTH) protein